MVCNRTRIKKIVVAFVKRLEKEKNLHVEEVILFGSYAWGRPSTRSDIDLAVVSSKFRRIDMIKRLMVLSSAARHIYSDWDAEIDAVGFTHDELEKAGYFELAGTIKEKGQLVYKRAA